MGRNIPKVVEYCKIFRNISELYINVLYEFRLKLFVISMAIDVLN